ncbi:MAG: flagellar hook-associated protein 3 [Bradymonadales bacterium]|nr:MAG: flagellar hook-associated protein 3 [Bradymonadales bacterium]
MGFRVSTTSSYLLFQRVLGLSNQRVLKSSEQLASGKRINRPSDDPEAVKTIASFRNSMGRIDQYLRNLQSADRHWTQAEQAINRVNEAMVRARELAIQGNNGTLGNEQRKMIAEEVHQLAQELLSAANTQINGEFIFGGYRTNQKPFELDPNYPDADPAAVFLGDSNLKRIEINEGQTLEIQMQGDRIFSGAGGGDRVDLFQTLARLEQALRTGNTDDNDPESIGQAIEDLGSALTQVQSDLASIGSRTRRIETTRDALVFQRDLIRQFISEKEDVDLAEATYEFQRAQLALQATVSSAGAVLNMPSLMDFIR